ncbi:porin [Bradyrhizobium sp. SYSU BS000235]|uniref:porin n=1 Tax=Bradyrhizobium sp. SYSU BS000235 TaxID=3411332 RepID=UPI003C70BF15
MSKMKTLILGSAAGIAAITGAQAADLPVKAKAVEYVKICSLYGAGFYYIPGTDTCIKFGGYIQADANFLAGNYNKPGWDHGGAPGQSNATAYSNALDTGSRDMDYFTTRSRAQLNIDTRTATEYGVVRTYWSSNFENSTGSTPSSGNITLDFAFVQFAGFTFGKAISGFQTPWGAYGGNQNTSYTIGGYDNATGITQAAYTWQFGNGVSAQIGVEDNRVINRAPLFNSGLAITGLGTFFQGAQGGSALTSLGATGGNVAPDIVGNIRVDQAAFTFQFSAAAHNLHASYYANPNGTTGIETNGHPGDEWGFAVSGGLQLKNLITGPGDKLSIDATYTDGAPKYVISGVTGNGFDHFSGGDNGFYNSLAFAGLFDGVFGTGTSIEKTKVWGFRGAFVHNWTPNWETSVFGSYTNVDYNGASSLLICNRLGITAAAAGATPTAGFSCNPDFNIWQVGSRTAWTPVRNLTFSGEVMYTVLDQSNTGGINLTSTPGIPNTFKPPGAYEFKDQGIWSGNVRVRRTF